MASSPESHPDFFDILTNPRAYTTAAFVLLSLGTGIFAFTFVVLGLSLSLGLLVLVIGIPLALAFLIGARAMAMGELWLLRTLVVDPPLGTPTWIPAGKGWMNRLKILFTDSRTWTSLFYLLLKLPMGVVGFTFMVVSLTLGLSFLAVPAGYLLQSKGGFDLNISGLELFGTRPATAMVVCLLLGVIFVPLTLHLGVALGRLHSWLARHLLLHAQEPFLEKP
jgi:hypothetical protein